MQAQKGPVPRLIDSQLDYLSASLPAGDPDYRKLLLWSWNVVVLQTGEGDELRKWNGHGYYGHQTKHFGKAESENGLILRCSGPESRKWAADMVFLAPGLRASRIDLQCTTREEREHHHKQRDLYLHICRMGEAGHKIGRLDKRIYEDRNGGATVTLGNPTSERQFRHYNKTIEMGETGPPWHHRWEMQARDKLAKKLLAGWSGSADRPEYSARQVRGYMSRYGIEEEWEWAPDAEWVPVGRKETDIELALNWMEKQVAPTAHRLAKQNRGAEMFKRMNFSPEFLERIAAQMREETTKLKIVA